MGASSDEMKDYNQHTIRAERDVTGTNETPADIEREIEITRADLDETVDELQRRLSPDTLINRAGDMFKDAVRGGAPKLADVVKRNPLPVAVIGLGVGWLIMRSRGERRDDYTAGAYYHPADYDTMEIGEATPGIMQGAKERLGEGAEGLRDKASGLAQSARDKASDMAQSTREKTAQLKTRMKEKAASVADRTKERFSSMAGHGRDRASSMASHAKETTSQLAGAAKDKTMNMASGIVDMTRDRANRLGHAAMEQSHKAKDGLAHYHQESPLAMGAILVAIGVAVGFSLPITHEENRMLGQKRDELIDQAKMVGNEAVAKVQQVAASAADAAKNAAREEAKDQNIAMGG